MPAVLDAQVRDQMIALLPRLRRFARGLAGTADQADDLVQAACERAITRIGQWTPGTRLDSWMFRIIQTIWLDERRAVKVRGGDNRLDPAEATEPELTVDGVRRMEAHLTFDAVRRAMGGLPEDQRVVLMLVCVEGLTYKEAAETLAVPIGTVMSRLARARLALAHKLGESATGDAVGDRVVRLGSLAADN
ncbi:MAG: RNA polymerase sigma factor [Rhodospirillales bacterium]|nr:RNA polymerase sigma factor [Rhodospirillales bacterium]